MLSTHETEQVPSREPARFLIWYERIYMFQGVGLSYFNHKMDCYCTFQ